MLPDRDEQRTMEDGATQLLICETLSLAISNFCTKSLGASGPRLLAGGPSGLLTLSLAPIGRPGHEIHAYIFVNLESS